MKIHSLQNSFSLSLNSAHKVCGKNINAFENSSLKICDIPSSAIKANYLPNFGKYKKVADVILIDKDTEMPVRASLRKEKTGDFISFQIITNKKDEAGFLHMNLDPSYARDKHIPLSSNGQVLPEITHLRSIKGDKYKGIGTLLVRAAINESLRSGKDGELFLTAETGYGNFYSNYRKDESPIPFYYKLGFVAEDKKIDKLIKNSIKKADYVSLPPSALLILSKEAVKAKNIQFSKEYNFG